MSPVQEMFTCKLSFCTLQTETLCSNRSLIHPTVIKLSSEASGSVNDNRDDAPNHIDGGYGGKTTRNVIPKKSDIENPRRLHRIYSDVCGPFDVEEYSRYFVTFIDGFSHHMRVKPIRSKDEVPKTLMEWSEVETGKRANILRTDGGGEYRRLEFQGWLKSRGMHHEMTNASIPQENGVAEHLNRTILEMTRAMLFESKLPKSFWTFAVNYT